jgi:hypothetical protein
MEMDADIFNRLYEAMIYLETKDKMEQLSIVSYPYMDKKDRNSLFKHYENITKAIKIKTDVEEKVNTVEDMESFIMGFLNGR